MESYIHAGLTGAFSPVEEPVVFLKLVLHYSLLYLSLYLLPLLSHYLPIESILTSKEVTPV